MNQAHRWRPGLLGALLVVAITSCGDDNQAKAVRDNFDPPATWTMIDSGSHAAGSITNSGPGAYASWKIPHPVTPTDIASLVEAAGWDLDTIEGDCSPDQNRRGNFPLCEALLNAEGLRGSLTVIGPTSTEGPVTATLTIGNR